MRVEQICLRCSLGDQNELRAAVRGWNGKEIIAIVPHSRRSTALPIFFISLEHLPLHCTEYRNLIHPG